MISLQSACSIDDLSAICVTTIDDPGFPLSLRGSLRQQFSFYGTFGSPVMTPVPQKANFIPRSCRMWSKPYHLPSQPSPQSTVDIFMEEQSRSPKSFRVAPITYAVKHVTQECKDEIEHIAPLVTALRASCTKSSVPQAAALAILATG